MNALKNPNQARKMAREQAYLRKAARKNPTQLSSKEKAKIDRELIFDNYDEEVFASQSARRTTLDVSNDSRYAED